MSNEKYKFDNGKLEINIKNEWKSIQCAGYDLLEVIGEGANGVVVKAEHQITERIDAIKIWLPHKKAKNGKVSQEQYLREVRKISKLKDEHIVTIYDASISHNGLVYMCAMEYIDGKSLKEWIKDDHNKWDRIKICKEILQTVENYQKAGIIHGDLHGGNIIIDKELHTHIIDFGTSLFGHDNQSKERESNFVYDLVKKIMKDEFKPEFFSIKNYDIFSEIKHNDDTRRYDPLLITRTMLQFLKLRDIKYQTVKMTNLDVLIEYCGNIAKGIYFNLEKVCSELLSWSDRDFVDPILGVALYENIYEIIFEPIGKIDYEELKYTTLYIYYEIFKNCKKDVSIEDSKKYYMERHIRFLSEKKYYEYINDLYEFECKSYIEYRSHLTTICDEENLYEREEYVRGILANLIENHYSYKFIFILYRVWQRLNEIRLDAELHYEIMSI
ncbi:protein kinase domain-containing protein [Clostridium perfringens]